MISPVMVKGGGLSVAMVMFQAQRLCDKSSNGQRRRSSVAMVMFQAQKFVDQLLCLNQLLPYRSPYGCGLQTKGLTCHTVCFSSLAEFT